MDIAKVDPGDRAGEESQNNRGGGQIKQNQIDKSEIMLTNGECQEKNCIIFPQNYIDYG